MRFDSNNPIILDLLGGSFVHNSWGNNLFGDKTHLDFATVAPSRLNHIMGIITDDYFYIYNFNENMSNELYSISNLNYSKPLERLSYKSSIIAHLDHKLLRFTKSAYNALISYKCGITLNN